MLWDLQAVDDVNGGNNSQNLEIYRMKGVLNLGGQAMRLVGS